MLDILMNRVSEIHIIYLLFPFDILQKDFVTTKRILKTHCEGINQNHKNGGINHKIIA